MQAKEVMNRNVGVVNANDTLSEAAQLMRDFDCGCLPVENQFELVGMITDRDIAVRAVAKGTQPQNARVSDFMTDEVKYCYLDDDINRVKNVMQKHHLNRLVVLNRANRLVGLIDQKDIPDPDPDEAEP